MRRKKFNQKNILISAAILFTILAIRHCEEPRRGDEAISGRLENQSHAFVKKVIDGDTIELGNGERVRYIGIDTPEISHHKKSAEYYGKEAKEFNKRLVFGKSIRLEFGKEKYDKYRRTLAYVYLEDETFVNEELIKNGYARTMSIKPNTKYASLFKELQNEAKIKRKGMWAR